MKRISALLAAVLVTAACTTPTGTDRAPAYFEGLRPVARDVTAAIAEVGLLFDGAYESQAMRSTRLTDLRVGSDLAIAADRAERLEPVSVYESDHEHYLDVIDDIRTIYRGFDEAVAGGDIAVAAVAAVGMEAAAGVGFAGLSAEYCAKVTFDMRLCNRPLDPIEYDAVVYTVMLDLTAGYTPLMRPVPAALDATEALAYLALIDPEAEARLQRTLALLASVDPPASLADDHAVLVSMLQEAAAIHARGGDHAILPEVFCSRVEALTQPTADLGAVFFQDDDLDCGL